MPVFFKLCTNALGPWVEPAAVAAAPRSPAAAATPPPLDEEPCPLAARFFARAAALSRARLSSNALASSALRRAGTALAFEALAPAASLSHLPTGAAGSFLPTNDVNEWSPLMRFEGFLTGSAWGVAPAALPAPRCLSSASVRASASAGLAWRASASGPAWVSAWFGRADVDRGTARRALADADADDADATDATETLDPALSAEESFVGGCLRWAPGGAGVDTTDADRASAGGLAGTGAGGTTSVPAPSRCTRLFLAE